MKGKLLLVLGRLWMVTTDLPLVNMYLQMEVHPSQDQTWLMAASPAAALVIIILHPDTEELLTNHCHP